MKIIEAKMLFKNQGNPVILQTLEDDPSRFCIQYGGGGRYFSSLPEVLDYISERFSKALTTHDVEAAPSIDWAAYARRGWRRSV